MDQENIMKTATARVARRASLGAGCLVVFLVLASSAMAQETAKSDTPKLDQIKALDWKSVDLAGLDSATQLSSLMAMEEILGVISGKGQTRRAMLAAYFEAKEQVDEYLTWSTTQTPA